MTTEEVLALLNQLTKRLGTVEDQAREARDQVQHVLDRVARLRQEVEKCHQEIFANVDTQTHRPLKPEKGKGGSRKT
jgi:cell division septum initiation protein DivIVA